jgi:hypothetical protein
MNGVERYPYAQGDLLENPHSYFFSTYQGEGFVSAWVSSRSECRAAIGKDNVLGDEIAEDIELMSCSPTQKYLGRVKDLFAEPEFPVEDRKNLNLILRNFEAKKRIYQDYNPGFTSKDRTDYEDLSLYVDFASLLVAAYARWKELPYLNALLKTLDILCAHCDMLSVSDKPRMVDLLDAEKLYVDELVLVLEVRGL